MNNKPPKLTLREAAEAAVNVLENLGYDPVDLREALAEQAEQEPVAWMNEERNTITWNELYPNMTPLYAAPVRTKDLTDDEIMQTYTNFNLNELGEQSFMIGFAGAVIAKDREKNRAG